MLETVKQYIKELPKEDFPTFYQNYVLTIQDENLGIEVNQLETFTDIGRFISKIQRELGNIS